MEYKAAVAEAREEERHKNFAAISASARREAFAEALERWRAKKDGELEVEVDSGGWPLTAEESMWDWLRARAEGRGE